MKLYWAPRTRSTRALWVLEEAGRAYERELLDLSAGAHLTREYRAINPMAKVPALTDGHATVAESGAICAYVADRAPEAGLAPALDDPARGRYLQFLFFSGTCTEPALMQKAHGWEVRSESAGWGDFERVFRVLEEAVTPGPWLLGERFSAADVMIGSDLNFAVRVFEMVPPSPAFDAYIDRCLERPAFQRAQAINEAGV